MTILVDGLVVCGFVYTVEVICWLAAVGQNMVLIVLSLLKRWLQHTVSCCALQEVNENSLKRLNGYLDNLQKPGPRSVQPMKLTFYVRDTKDSSDVQPDLFTSGTVSINTAPNICDFCLLINLNVPLVFRVPLCEFHPANK